MNDANIENEMVRHFISLLNQQKMNKIPGCGYFLDLKT